MKLKYWFVTHRVYIQGEDLERITTTNTVVSGSIAEWFAILRVRFPNTVVLFFHEITEEDYKLLR